MDILGIEKLSLVDYEGHMCATVFTGGCNFRCPFCHNSGLVNQEGKPINQSEIFLYLEKRKGLLDAVTISGGEPTLQKDLEQFIVKVKSLGYKVKLDTNGTMPEVLTSLLNKGLLDYVAMDIKNGFHYYGSTTGVENCTVESIKQSLRALDASGVKYELRTTLVAEFHDMNSIEMLSKDLEGKALLYLQKFVDSGACIKNGLSAVSKETAKKYQQVLQKTVTEVKLRGY